MHFIGRQLPAGYCWRQKNCLPRGPVETEYILPVRFLSNHQCAPQWSSISIRSNTPFTEASTGKYYYWEIFSLFVSVNNDRRLSRPRTSFESVLVWCFLSISVITAGKNITQTRMSLINVQRFLLSSSRHNKSTRMMFILSSYVESRLEP
jgi:hypothetical protein